MAPRLLLALSLALLAWVACAQPTCPDLAMQVRSVKKKAIVGGTVKLKAKVRNTGATRQQDVAIGITLPDSVWSTLRPVATAAKQHGAYTVSAKYQAPGVYWLPLSLPAGKGARVSVKARLAACPALAGTTLAFRGVVYKTNATGDVTCATASTGRAVTMVKALKRSHHAHTAPPSVCASPTPAPGAPFVLVAENQRVLGAQQQFRRRVLPAAGEEKGGAAWAATRRELPPQQYTVNDCYEACSAAEFVVPFYMSFNQPPTGPASCYCSQTSYPLVNAPDWQVYRIDTPMPTSQVGRPVCRHDTLIRLEGGPRPRSAPRDNHHYVPSAHPQAPSAQPTTTPSTLPTASSPTGSPSSLPTVRTPDADESHSHAMAGAPRDHHHHVPPAHPQAPSAQPTTTPSTLPTASSPTGSPSSLPTVRTPDADESHSHAMAGAPRDHHHHVPPAHPQAPSAQPTTTPSTLPTASSPTGSPSSLPTVRTPDADESHSHAMAGAPRDHHHHVPPAHPQAPSAQPTTTPSTLPTASSPTGSPSSLPTVRTPDADESHSHAMAGAPRDHHHHVPPAHPQAPSAQPTTPPSTAPTATPTVTPTSVHVRVALTRNDCRTSG
jgi:hypothetical protein